MLNGDVSYPLKKILMHKVDVLYAEYSTIICRINAVLMQRFYSL